MHRFQNWRSTFQKEKKFKGTNQINPQRFGFPGFIIPERRPLLGRMDALKKKTRLFPGSVLELGNNGKNSPLLSLPAVNDCF